MPDSLPTRSTPLRAEEIRFFAALSATRDGLQAREELLRLERAHLSALEQMHHERICLRLGLQQGRVRIDWQSMTAATDSDGNAAVPQGKEPQE